MMHYGKIIYNMSQLTGRPLKEVAKEAGYTEQAFYRIIKKKDLNTKVIATFARVCKRKVLIEVK
jgi:hypothetical protein